MAIYLDNLLIVKIEKANIKAAEKAMGALLKDTQDNATIPKDTGALEEGHFITCEGSNNHLKLRIATDRNYDRYLYFGLVQPKYDRAINFNQKKNANAQSHWFETYVSGAKQDFVMNEYVRLLKEELQL